MTESAHITPQITDYVLGLLPVGERRCIEMHITTCSECRRAVLEESKLSLVVRSTVQSMAWPDASQLRQLMPDVTKRMSTWQYIWQRQLAPAALFLVLLIGGFGMWQLNQSSIWANPSPTFLAATATQTDVPTATIAQTQLAQEEGPVHTAVANSPQQPAAAITPGPRSTPQVLEQPLDGN
jgi:anti-sigma factor RsiW